MRVRAASYDLASPSIRLTLVGLVAKKPLTVTATGLVGAGRTPVAALAATI